VVVGFERSLDTGTLVMVRYPAKRIT
jgi:hypothetical protein